MTIKHIIICDGCGERIKSGRGSFIEVLARYDKDPMQFCKWECLRDYIGRLLEERKKFLKVGGESPWQ